MMITKTAQFIKGHMGKGLLYSLMASILYMAYGCVAYRQVPMPKEDFMASERIQRYLDHYSIYVHDGGATFRMEDVQAVDNRDLSGRLVTTDYAMPGDDMKRSERKAWWRAHKYDIHIYTHDNLMASTQQGLALVEGQVVLKDQMIKEVQVMGIDMKKSVSAGVIVLIVLATLILFPLVLVLSIVASVESGASDSDSDSDSDSGDSSGS
jgi:hypothetical protein